MKIQQLSGCGTALATPFTKTGAVDYQTFNKLVKRQIKNGVNFLVPLGSTGEASCLTNEEKTKLLEITVTEANGKLPVIAGIGSNCTQGVIDNIKMFTKTGVDGWLIVTPYYNKPTQTGLYTHYKIIADNTDKAIVLYNIPGRTGVNMSAVTCLKIAEIKNIIGIKEASSNYAQISEIIRNAPCHFVVLSGNDNETLPLMATGAKGVICTVSNIVPKEMSNLTKILLKNDFVTGRKIHHQLTDLFINCFIETNPIPLKAGMYKMGLLANVLRPPLYPAKQNTIIALTKTLKKLGLL